MYISKTVPNLILGATENISPRDVTVVCCMYTKTNWCRQHNGAIGTFWTIMCDKIQDVPLRVLFCFSLHCSFASHLHLLFYH